MPRRLIPFIASLLVLTMSLGALLVSRGAVICSDSQGTRIELACLQDKVGQCSVTHDSADNQPTDNHQGAPSPCEDRPLKTSNDSGTQLQLRVELPTFDALPIPQPVIWTTAQLPHALPPIPAAHSCPRPPDPLLSLSTIVLTV